MKILEKWAESSGSESCKEAKEGKLWGTAVTYDDKGLAGCQHLTMEAWAKEECLPIWNVATLFLF